MHVVTTPTTTTTAMDDVRSMLRAERESRRITHPHASYTSTGNLLCNICEVPVKSERAWGAHLHTTQHSLRLARERDAAQARTAANTPSSKKRKAVEFEETPEVERKRVKSISQAHDHDEVHEAEDDAEATTQSESVAVEIVPPAVQEELDDAAAAAELEALQRDLAALEQDTFQNGALAALSAPATIAAPAMTVQEIAAQAREEQSKQRSRRDEEIENEREDATRALEDEFEEMDSLQERLRKLRERREALRTRIEVDKEGSAAAQPEHAQSIPDRSVDNTEDKQIENGDSEDSEDDDDWAFGAR